MPNKIADMTKAINVFTKTLLWKLTEGHPVEQEEIDALNEMRSEAGMKPLNIAIPSSSKTPEPEKKAPGTPAGQSWQNRTPPYQQHETEDKPRSEGKPPRSRKPPKTTDDTSFNPEAITVNGRTFEGELLPEGRDWTNRFYVKSESSERLYTIAQNKRHRYWGCDCPGWIGHRKCKHLKALELPWYEKPFEAQIGPAATAGKTSSTLIKFADDNYSPLAYILAAEFIHNDAELASMMEGTPAKDVYGEAHIDGPEAGASNDELHANQHEENGVPVTDGGIKSPERQNVNAIREAIETQAEMEVGKPIGLKQEQVNHAVEQSEAKLNGEVPAATAEVSAKPGTQVVINIASKRTKTSAVPDTRGLTPEVARPGGPLKKGERITIKPEWQDPGDDKYEWIVVRDEVSGYGGNVGIMAIPKDKAEHERWNQTPPGLRAWSDAKSNMVERFGEKTSAEPIGGEDDSKITSGQGGGMFGGTDLEGPAFHVGFTFRGVQREASFSSLKEAQTFVKSASKKFGKVASGWVIEAAADPAKRNLVLELLKGHNLSTEEIEKKLGGGQYTNMAYPILQELAKEGLVSHKKMRWSLKASVAKKAYRVGKLSFSLETRVNAENKTDVFKAVVDRLNEIHGELKRKNPQGFMDSFEQQLPSRMMDIAQALGLQVDYTPENDTYMFYDAAGAGTRNKEFGEFDQQQASEQGDNALEQDEPNVERVDRRDPKQQFGRGKGPFSDTVNSTFETLRKHNKGSINITSAQALPRKGSPEEAELKIAIQTLKMPDPMQNVMGGPGREHALQTLQRYGLRWDEEAYMSGGTGVKKAGDGMAKTETELEKEAGFNFFFPGQVVKEFYPEIQHEIVDYPNATNQPMSGAGSPEIVGDGGHELEGILDEALDTNIMEMIQLPADIGEVEPLAMAAADYSSTSPAGGLGIGRDGKPEVLEGAPLRKENDIRGYMFTDEFYGQYEGIPGAAMAVASKTAAEGDETKQFALFLKKVCGEIAATLVAAFKVTSRPLLDKVPGMGEIQLDTIEQGSGTTMPLGQITQGGRVKWLMDKLNDGDIKAAINEAWAQAAVWNDNSEGGFVYEVFVRPETIDTDSLVMKYKFVCGTRE